MRGSGLSQSNATEFKNKNIKPLIFRDILKKVHFVNKDIKQTLPDGTVIYFYSEHETTQITLPNNNLDIYRFPNAQVEFHFKNGNKQIK